MMNIKKRAHFRFYLLLGYLFIITGPCYLHAENQKTLEEVIAEKVAFKSQNPHAGIAVRDIIDHYDPNRVFTHAMQLIQDPNAVAREYGYQLLQATGITYQNPVIREATVRVFIDDFTDPDQPSSCAEMLQENFQKEDYNVDAKKKLRQRLDEILSNRSRGYYARDIILLVGAADMQTEMDRLQGLIDNIHEPLQPFGAQPPKWHEEAFAALKARARMGDQDAVQRCISLVDAQTDEDFKVLTLLKHIAYIRQPKAVDYIKQYLYSDKKAASRGPDTVVYPYSYHSAGYLEEMIVGFPKKADIANHIMKYGFDDKFREKWPTYITDGGDMAHILNCRQWLEAQDSIEIIR